MAEYFQVLDMKGLPVNVVQTVGHTQVRRIVLGDADRRPSPEELDRCRTWCARRWKPARSASRRP
jgi:N-acyl-D-amino-acid deacylase